MLNVLTEHFSPFTYNRRAGRGLYNKCYNNAQRLKVSFSSPLPQIHLEKEVLVYFGFTRKRCICNENIVNELMLQSPFNKIGQPHNTDTRQALNPKTAFSNPIYLFS